MSPSVARITSQPSHDEEPQKSEDRNPVRKGNGRKRVGHIFAETPCEEGEGDIFGSNQRPAKERENQEFCPSKRVLPAVAQPGPVGHDNFIKLIEK